MISNTLSCKQSGAALLAFMLIVIAGTSFLLVTKLNANLVVVEGDLQTRLALNVAKEALIGYAATYPDNVNSSEGPGYLPCPDSDKDGDAEGNCSDTGSIRTIGRLPYKTLELTDIRDGSGQAPWYVLSENFRYGSSKIVPLNNESPESAQLSVNGANDIVAIIIAPGEPVNFPDDTPQSRDPNENVIVNEIQNYLEDDNNNLDTAFVTSANDDFNDVVAVITREELMKAVEKRVLGEVKMMLASYNATYGAYPLLTPFADPKAEFKNPAGTHNGSDNDSNLRDTTRNFTELDIQNGDMVINITDGSMGAVTGVSANVLVLGGLALGTENAFDEDDEYVVVKTNWSTNILSGTATSGTSNLVLVDTSTNNDFVEMGVSAGDIVDNFNTGLSSLVEEVVSSTRLNIKENGGFALTAGDSYHIRSNVSRATGPVDSATLVDTNKDFIEMGIQAGDLVVNLTDGSSGMVSAIATNTLTLNSLNNGTDNDFDTNDYYYIPRYNTDSSAREGLLASHEEGKLFPTAFGIDFNIAANSGDIAFDAVNFPGAQATYTTALQTYIGNYVNSNSVSFTLAEGTCRWIVPDIADCYGSFEDFVNISGKDTASVNSQTQITDSTAEFITDGVKRGDLAHNYDDEVFVTSGTADAGSDGTKLVDAGADFSVYEPYNYVIQNDTLETELGEAKIQGVISEVSNSTTLVATAYVGEGTEPIEFRPGDVYRIYEPRKDMVVTNAPSNTTATISRLSSTNPDFDSGEYYRIIPAAKSTAGSVDSTSPGTCTASGVCQITDTGADFINEGVEIGDTIENTSDSPNPSFGEITAVTSTTVTLRLYGGTQNLFAAGNNYTIYHDYVHSRRHEIHTRFSGNQQTNPLSEKRVRDVCVGYTSDCSTVSTPVNFSGNGGVSLLTTRDYEIDGTTEVGRATFLPTVLSSGSLRVADIDYYLAESSGDIPEWFLKNKWHQLVYIAYSADYVPGGAADCITSGNCLTVTGAGLPNDDNKAVVIIAGEEVDTQDRTAAGLDDYFELENADQGDNEFQHAAKSTTYNDQDKLIE